MSFHRRIARFNRTFANPIVGQILPRFPGFGTVHHRGRKSGRQYRTPVKVFRNGNNYVISLTLGSDSDWVRNVLAADGCDLVTGGGRVHLVSPTLYVDHDPAEIPAFIRMVLKRVNTGELLTLKPAGATSRQA